MWGYTGGEKGREEEEVKREGEKQGYSVGFMISGLEHTAETDS